MRVKHLVTKCLNYNFFSQTSVIFIKENAAFNQVLTYQDWRNQLINTINCILLLNFKESFFNYLKLGGKVADAFRWCLLKALQSVYFTLLNSIN